MESLDNGIGSSYNCPCNIFQERSELTVTRLGIEKGIAVKINISRLNGIYPYASDGSISVFGVAGNGT
jgi:hypothetical protein